MGDGMISHMHTQPFNGRFSATTRVMSRYQKKPSSTHSREEEERFTQTMRSNAHRLHEGCYMTHQCTKFEVSSTISEIY